VRSSCRSRRAKTQKRPAPSSVCPKPAHRRVPPILVRCSRPSWIRPATTVDGVTKSELIAILAGRYPQLAVRDRDIAVKTMLEAMTQALASGQRIEIRGFGSFSLSASSPRIGPKPRSGRKVMVHGKQVPHLKAGKEWRGRVDSAAREKPGDAGSDPAADRRVMSSTAD